MADLQPLLKEVYIDRLNDQLNSQIIFFGEHKGFTPYKPTFKEKWNRFWNHIPDFIDFVKEYKYEYWRYWDRD